VLDESWQNSQDHFSYLVLYQDALAHDTGRAIEDLVHLTYGRQELSLETLEYICLSLYSN
jgi:hypothetical protein